MDEAVLPFGINVIPESGYITIYSSTDVETPKFIDRVVDATFAQDHDADRARLVEEHDRLSREIENLTKGIATGGDIPALAAACKKGTNV